MKEFSPRDLLRRQGERRRRLAIKRQAFLAGAAFHFDLMHLLAAGHTQDFDEGYPHHRDHYVEQKDDAEPLCFCMLQRMRDNQN